MNNFKRKIILFGHDKIDKTQLKEPFFIEATNIVTENILPEVGTITGPKIDKKQIFNLSEEFIDTFYKDLDKNVLSITEEDVNNLFYLYQENKYDFKTILDIYEFFIKKTNIKDIPVKLNKFNPMDSSVKEAQFIMGNKKQLKKMPILNIQVNLSENLTSLAIGSYIHENTHMLLERNKGYVDDYLKSELLSIFLEKLVAYELDESEKLLQIYEINRWRGIQDDINNVKQISNKNKKNEYYKYIVSNFLAEVMFDRYKQSNSNEQYQLIKGTEEVMAGTKTLQDLLREQDINLKSQEVVDITKKSIQKCKKIAK